MSRVMQANKDLYHYTACGLDNVYLTSGVEIHETPYGRGVSIHDVDGLHRCIGEELARHKKLLNGKEIRFLRKHMDLTQAELGKFLGLSDQQVARYEKEECTLTGSADRMLRAVFLNHLDGKIDVRELAEELEKFDDLQVERQLYREDRGRWQPSFAAA